MKNRFTGSKLTTNRKTLLSWIYQVQSSLSLSSFFFVISPWPHATTAPSPPHPLRPRSSPGFSALFREPLMTFSFSGLFRALSSPLPLCLSSTETSSLSLPTSDSSPLPFTLPLAPSYFIGDMAAVFLNLLLLPFQLISARGIKRSRRIASHAKKIPLAIWSVILGSFWCARLPILRSSPAHYSVALNRNSFVVFQKEHWIFRITNFCDEIFVLVRD